VTDTAATGSRTGDPASLPWDERRTRLDDNRAFNTMRDTPYYRDTVYEQFSPAEYERRRELLRAKMRERDLDCLILPGGPSHWSFGGGMLWLTGHREWHALAAYVVLPLQGEPTLVYAMGGTHIEAVRRVVAGAVADVRSSRGGQFAEVMAERIRELGLETGRIGLLEVDARHRDHLPVNQFETLRRELPGAELVLTHGLLHEVMLLKSTEEIAVLRRSGELCQRAMEALVERAAPGVTEYQLRAAATHAILDGGGELDFAIIGSTPMRDPALVFGNPQPSGRVLSEGDIIIMELAAGYRGYAAQIGSPICVGQPTDEVRRFWDDVVLPGYQLMVDGIGPGRTFEGLREAGRFFRQQGAQSRPIHVHCIDLVTASPHVFTDHVDAGPAEQVMQPGMVVMAEPNPITADGSLGIFLGHTFVVTETGRECLDDFPLELVVAGS
jgi:Xaa-Pro aminopeptidase